MATVNSKRTRLNLRQLEINVIRALCEPTLQNGGCHDHKQRRRGHQRNQQGVINAISIEPEDILEGHDPASRLRISIVNGE